MNVESIPLCSPRKTSLHVLVSYEFIYPRTELTNLNFFNGFEYDPTALCAMSAYV